MKCHSSSNSISRIAPDTAGSATRVPSWQSHFSTAGGVIPNSLAIKPSELLPMPYSSTAKARFTAPSGLTRASPATKFSPHPLHLYRCLLRTRPFLTLSPQPHDLQFMATALQEVNKMTAILSDIYLQVKTLSCFYAINR